MSAGSELGKSTQLRGQKWRWICIHLKNFGVDETVNKMRKEPRAELTDCSQLDPFYSFSLLFFPLL